MNGRKAKLARKKLTQELEENPIEKGYTKLNTGQIVNFRRSLLQMIKGRRK